MKLERMLLVDDDPDYAMVVEDCIHGWRPDMKVEKAATGNAALEADLKRFDMVLMDQNLPDINGYELLTLVLGRVDLPVIMLTGEDNITLAINALKAGAMDFLLKSPNIAAVLPAVIERVCRSWDRKQESERLKERLMQSEKMSAIGLLAAGVAHEINNPIGFVMSNIGTLTGYVGAFKKVLRKYETLAGKVRGADAAARDTLLSEMESVHLKEDLPYMLDDIDKLLAESMEGTERIRDIVHNLKSFARVDETSAREASINEGIETTLKVVWNELKYKCDVHKKLGELPLIRCYPGQLNQVFLNVLVNAAQAIEEHGDITIETQHLDGHVVIRFSDTGGGIRPEHLSRIFDPFFTTKAVGQGTGLGLSISHGIIRKHHGTIDVESELGKGTTFTIRLPVEGIGNA